MQGIILDLRNNPGGYLQEALRVGSQFLPEQEVILHEKDAKEQITTYRSEGEGLAREIPMVVLINPGSASAAEIIAGALQENGRAKLVGEATVGTGTVLRPFSLSDGSVLRLGVTNWLTPEYNSDQGRRYSAGRHHRTERVGGDDQLDSAGGVGCARGAYCTRIASSRQRC